MNNPTFLHAVFINSQVNDNAWADRTSLYFASTDAGATWLNLGGVPVNNGMDGRSGFPCIVGTSDGRAVIANYNNSENTTTHTKIFIDSSPFANNFTTYDPGEPTTGPTLWPRLAILPNDDIVMASSGAGLYTNTLSGTVFSDWQLNDGEAGAEIYSIAVSKSGSKVGFAYLGQQSSGQQYWVFYKESTDGGLSWSAPTVVWQAYADSATGNIRSCLAGVCVSFFGEDPCVVFEVGWNTPTGYYPGLPSEIRFWSPNINGGNSKVIADSSNVPFFPNYGLTDEQYPLSRPVIGRSQLYDYLFVAFNATNGEYWPYGTSSADSTAYMCGMFMYSADGGNNWSYPERITPTSPLLDLRFISIIPVSPASNDNITVHLVMQGDSIPGSSIFNWGTMPLTVSAQYYHYSTDFVSGIQSEQRTISSFKLEQNYPNPFNPITTIQYAVPSMQFISLKVYDILGSEVATLVNEEKPAGEYEVKFDATSLPSGTYFYQFKAGSFIQTKKMILMK